jgi:hypothetical protein
MFVYVVAGEEPAEPAPARCSDFSQEGTPLGLLCVVDERQP